MLAHRFRLIGADGEQIGVVSVFRSAIVAERQTGSGEVLTLAGTVPPMPWWTTANQSSEEEAELPEEGKKQSRFKVSSSRDSGGRGLPGAALQPVYVSQCWGQRQSR